MIKCEFKIFGSNCENNTILLLSKKQSIEIYYNNKYLKDYIFSCLSCYNKSGILQKYYIKSYLPLSEIDDINNIIDILNE